MMTLVIGGAASGKSEYAEQLVCSLPGDRVYLATMYPWDEESKQRIRKHREARAQKGFTTVEQYRSIHRAKIPEHSNVLLECLTNLTANELFTEQGVADIDECASRIVSEIMILAQHCDDLTIVSGEVGSGGIRYEGDTLSYLKALGMINRRLASKADRVIEVVCGLENEIKGEKKKNETAV